jgi:hypothetical protein
LKYFKAYRYHPNYVEDVKDGYRSLTYSHQINSQQPFCPYEAAGGVCNDSTCDFQHWRDIVMPGALTAQKYPPSLDPPTPPFIYTALFLPLRLYVIFILGQALTSGSI